MTPTAQLADYVLPGDSWLERPWMFDGYGWLSIYKPSQKSMDPPGECKSTFELWKLTANALGMPEVVPWETLESFYDYRIAKLGIGFEEFSNTYEVHADKLEFRKYEKTGFATPSGKVELYSSILENLGFDPLPYFRDEPPADPAFPLAMFTGVREGEYFQTGGRHIPEMRARKPEPNRRHGHHALILAAPRLTSPADSRDPGRTPGALRAQAPAPGASRNRAQARAPGVP